MIAKPSDLITAQQAAVLTNKSKNTIRYWVRQGMVNGYRQDESKQNSALMVSREQVVHHVASHQPNQAKSTSATMILLHQKLQELWEKNAQLEDKVSNLENENYLLQDTIRKSKVMEDRLKELCDNTERELNYQLQRIDDVSQHAAQLELRVQQLSSYVSLPWWRRWFASFPMLTSSQA